MPIRQRTFEQRHKREGAATRRRVQQLGADCFPDYSPLSDIAAGATHGLFSLLMGGPISPFAHGAMARGAYEMARGRAEEGEDE